LPAHSSIERVPARVQNASRGFSGLGLHRRDGGVPPANDWAHGLARVIGLSQNYRNRCEKKN
jgi:hypothetical protein